MNIKTNHFCGLSTSSDFRKWLKSIATDLYDQLINNPRKGCRANKDRMIEIKDKLYERGLGDKLEEFINSRFPYMVDKVQTKSKTIPIKIVQSIEDNINKHKVFKGYRPDLLSFPHKRIIIGNPTELLIKVKNFIIDKVGIDYIIIDDHAYIEYFLKRYSDIAEKIKSEDRDIWQYKQRIGQHKGI